MKECSWSKWSNIRSKNAIEKKKKKQIKKKKKKQKKKKKKNAAEHHSEAMVEKVGRLSLGAGFAGLCSVAQCLEIRPFFLWDAGWPDPSNPVLMKGYAWSGFQAVGTSLPLPGMLEHQHQRTRSGSRWAVTMCSVRKICISVQGLCSRNKPGT